MSEHVRFRAEPDNIKTLEPLGFPSVMARAKFDYDLNPEASAANPNALPGNIEKPPRFSQILEAVQHGMKKIYPDAYVLTDERIGWMNKDSFEEFYNNLPHTPGYTLRALQSIGAQLDEHKFTNENVRHHEKEKAPTYVVFRDDVFGGIENEGFKERTWSDFLLVHELITISLYESRIPKNIPYSDNVLNLLNERLELEKRNAPKVYKTVDTKKLSTMIENYRLMITQEEDPLIQCDGASLFYVSRISDSDTTRDEGILGVGLALNLETAKLLNPKATYSALRLLADSYPVKFQDIARKRFKALVDGNMRGTDITRGFYKSIGLAGEENIFQAYYRSEIPERFMEAKQKHPRIVYPV